MIVIFIQYKSGEKRDQLAHEDYRSIGENGDVEDLHSQ